MKVLWFTNVPLPSVVQRLGLSPEGFGGHWMATLAEALKNCPDLQLAVATAFPGLRDQTFVRENVRYYSIGQPPRFPTFRMRPEDLRRAVACVEDFQPDLIHLHGTERFYGLIKARHQVPAPAIASLQGILGPYAQYNNYFGALSPRQILSSTSVIEFLARRGLLWGYRDIRHAARREREICCHLDGFLGRTRWDAAWARILNPQARYFYVGEILRPEFGQSAWDLSQVDRHTIIYTNAGHPRRGTEVLLEAVRLLQRDFPDVRLRLAGRISPRSGYGRFLNRLIQQLGLEQHVDFLGFLNAVQMSRALLSAHVFAITSFIENSPNSLAEAMMVGMPCVASYTGGIPDMVEHRQTGLLFPVGDAALLADSIKIIFSDDNLATRWGRNANQAALQRHSPELVVAQLLTAYQQILSS
jgi:glycosyltransferase involved in cell wall biosynthesis